MPRTGITGDQVQDSTLSGDDVADGTIFRQDLNTTSTGKAVIRKIRTSTGLTMAWDGIDEGTGDIVLATDITSTGLLPSTHRTLDQLVHELAEDAYCEIIRTNGRVSQIIFWEDLNKLKKIREFIYTRVAGRISQIEVKQYDSSGNLITGEYLTGTINITGGRISSMNWSLA